ncbi:MAG: T9SS type A sorting domain-containing protein, partial [Ignavibacteriales bacterium]|nr:T9SS type A sorting domain-containing protein [Ignavibacteriales bacterium]
DVYAWWPANAVNADNVKVSLKTGSQTVEKIVNQKINGAAWNLIGSISLPASGEISVAVSDSANGRIAADAFRVIYTGAPQGTEQNVTPDNFALKQNYPNPFNASSIISYSLQNTSEVKLTVYNTLGQEVIKLVDENKSPGSYEVRFNGASLASGVYYYRLQVGAYSVTKAMVLLK